jgi:hypothetical protein
MNHYLGSTKFVQPEADSPRTRVRRYDVRQQGWQLGLTWSF